MYHEVMAGERDEIRSASRALRDAASAFSRALGETFVQAGTQASQEIADELRQATKELDDAIAELGVRRTPKAERTRGDLLAAARKVFAEKGYEGASVGDVAAAAGYTKGAVYANFGSKEELFLELARELTAQDAALADSREPVDPRELFAVRPADDEATQQMLLALELYVYAIRHPEARDELARVNARGHDAVATVVHRARSSSAPVPGPDEDGGEPTQDDRDTAFGLVAVHHLASILAPLFDDPDEASGLADRLIARLLAD